jgi:hypothetical protein
MERNHADDSHPFLKYHFHTIVGHVRSLIIEGMKVNMESEVLLYTGRREGMVKVSFRIPLWL